MDPVVVIQVAEPQLAVGDTVRASVSVLRDEPKAEGLDLFLEYGGKRIHKQELGLSRVVQGPLTAGQSFARQLTIPNDAPFTFQGHEHSVEWRVVARVDMPWAKDLRTVVPLNVRPRAVDGSAAAIETATKVSPQPDKQEGWLAKIVLWTIVGSLVLLAAAFLLPFVLWYFASRRLLRTKLTDFELVIPDRHFVLGEWVPVTVRFRLKRAIEVVGLTLKFEGIETWRTGSGNTSQTHTHHFLKREQAVLEHTIVALAPEGGNGGHEGGSVYRSMGRKRSAEPVFEWRTAVQLPHDGLPTVPHAVYYKVHAKAELPGWPDPEASKTIPTVGAALTVKPPQPEDLLPEETSGALAFYGEGQQLPDGVVVAPKGRIMWQFILLPTIGLALAVGGILNFANPPLALWVAMTVAGLLLLISGLIAFYAGLFR